MPLYSSPVSGYFYKSFEVVSLLALRSLRLTFCADSSFLESLKLSQTECRASESINFQVLPQIL